MSNVENKRHDSWYTFRAPDRDFVVNFPGKPEYREFPNPDTGIPDHKYYFHFGENTFIASYREEPEAATQPDEVMHRVVQKISENNDTWRLIQHIRLRDGSHYIENQGVVGGIPVYMRTKLYLRGTRLYYVSTLTRNLTGPNKADVIRSRTSQDHKFPAMSPSGAWPEKMKLSQARKFLGVSHGKITALVNSGVLKYEIDPLDHRIKLIKRDDLEALQRQRTHVE